MVLLNYKKKLNVIEKPETISIQYPSIPCQSKNPLNLRFKLELQK